MAISYFTDHAGIEQALITWLETYASLPAGSTRFLNNVVGRPSLPYGTLYFVTEGVVEGIDAEFQFYDVGTDHLDFLTYGDRRLTVQVEIYTDPEVEIGTPLASATNKLNALLASLRNQQVKSLFRDQGMAFLRPLGSIRRLDEQLGQRWERRAQIDLEFGYTSLLKDEPDATDTENWIETVETPKESDGTLTVEEN